MITIESTAINKAANSEKIFEFNSECLTKLNDELHSWACVACDKLEKQVEKTLATVYPQLHPNRQS